MSTPPGLVRIHNVQHGGSLMKFNDGVALSSPKVNIDNNWHFTPTGGPPNAYIIEFIDTNGVAPGHLVITVEPDRGQDKMMDIVLRQLRGSDTQAWTVRGGPEGSYQICSMAIPFMCMRPDFNAPVQSNKPGVPVSAMRAEGGGPEMWWRMEYVDASG